MCIRTDLKPQRYIYERVTTHIILLYNSINNKYEIKILQDSISLYYL